MNQKLLGSSSSQQCGLLDTINTRGNSILFELAVLPTGKSGENPSQFRRTDPQPPGRIHQNRP